MSALAAFIAIAGAVVTATAARIRGRQGMLALERIYGSLSIACFVLAFLALVTS